MDHDQYLIETVETQKRETEKETQKMKSISASDIAEMPIQQRLQLVEDIWDSIAEMPESVKIPSWHKKELEVRLKAYHENPNEGTPWSEVKMKILG